MAVEENIHRRHIDFGEMELVVLYLYLRPTLKINQVELGVEDHHQ